jgi:hypothetical protein
VLALAKRGLVLIEIENRALDSDNEGHFRSPLHGGPLGRRARPGRARLRHGLGRRAPLQRRGRGERRAGGVAYVGDRGFVMVRAELDRRERARGDRAAATSTAARACCFDRLEISRDAIAVDVHDDGRGGPIKLELVGPSGVVERGEGRSRLRVDPRASHQPFSHERYLRRARPRRAREAGLQPAPFSLDQGHFLAKSQGRGPPWPLTVTV